MTLRRVFAALAITIVASVHGAPQKVDIAFDSLALKNGRTLSQGVVKTYDPETRRVVIVCGKDITSIPPGLLPDDLASQLDRIVPRGPSRSENEPPRRAPAHTADRRNQDATPPKAAESRSDAPATNEAKQRDALNSLIKRRAKEAASRRADRYFRYEMKPGSGATFVIRRDVEVEEPQEVPGWDRRYRVRGTIGLEFYDSKGNSFNSTIRSFEVMVEGDKDGNVNVVDFSQR